MTTLPMEITGVKLKFGALPRGAEPFVIVGMFTPSYGRLAKRLVSSLRTLALSHAIFEVPAVHRSISVKGTADLAYSKPNFIRQALELAKRPVLYLDIDCVLRKTPALIFAAVKEGLDFAILNWLALEDNDAYAPLLRPGQVPLIGATKALYRHANRIPWESQDQLICSGATQFWANSDSAQALLAAWLETIEAQPGAQDDMCLDFAFNNNIGESRQGTFHAKWLPKSYARYAWWIFDEPVIDHPQLPNKTLGWATIVDSKGRERFRPADCKPRLQAPLLAPDRCVDVRTGRVLSILNQGLIETGRLDRRIWV